MKKPSVGTAQTAPRNGPSPAPSSQHQDQFGDPASPAALACPPAHTTEPSAAGPLQTIMPLGLMTPWDGRRWAIDKTWLQKHRCSPGCFSSSSSAQRTLPKEETSCPTAQATSACSSAAPHRAGGRRSERVQRQHWRGISSSKFPQWPVRSKDISPQLDFLIMPLQVTSLDSCV